MSTDLHVETLGNGERGETVLLLHSSGLSGRQWRRLSSTLAARGYRVLVPDLAGHGSSPSIAEPTPFGYRDDVDNIRALVAESGPLHLVGHSYGGLIAILAALQAGEAVRSTVLFDPVAFGVLDPHVDAEVLLDLRVVTVPWGDSAADHDRWLQAFVDYWGGKGAWATLREEARAEFRRTGWVVHEGVMSLLGDDTPPSAYAVVAGQVTVLTGETSPRAAGAVASRLVASLPRARVLTVPGAGHMGPLSHAEAVNGLVVDALAQAASL